MSETRGRHRLTPSEEVKIGVPPLVVTAVGRATEYINDKVYSLRGGPLGHLNPADYVGNMWWSALIGMAAYSAAATCERISPKLEKRIASIALASACGAGLGFTVNAGWETTYGVEQVTSHIPEDTPLLNKLNGTGFTSKGIDLAAGTTTSGLVALAMASQRQFYLRRDDDFFDV